MFTENTDLLFTVDTPFARDVAEGLTSEPKTLPSKYFYDARGDALFQKIMHMPEYYLTDCELEIISTHKTAMLQAFGNDFNLVELGAGDGFKTKVLLEHFLKKKASFEYKPIDISQNVLEILERNLKSKLPSLKMEAIQGDYFDALEKLQLDQDRREVVMFLGANIGNMTKEEAIEFLHQVRDNLVEDDMLLIGFDLKKDPATILNAYNDKAGITRDFNLNLLSRINRELDADFNLRKFSHWETYNPLTGETESFIVSRQAQQVNIQAIDLVVNFEAWEAMKVELSQKYSISEIESLANEAGFAIERHFFDDRMYFVDSLWRAV